MTGLPYMAGDGETDRASPEQSELIRDDDGKLHL